MGTFTKSFGSCGGYVAGSEELIQFLKTASPVRSFKRYLVQLSDTPRS